MPVKVVELRNLYHENFICPECGNMKFEEHPDHADVYWCKRCGRGMADPFKYIEATSKKSAPPAPKHDGKK